MVRPLHYLLINPLLRSYRNRRCVSEEVSDSVDPNQGMAKRYKRTGTDLFSSTHADGMPTICTAENNSRVSRAKRPSYKALDNGANQGCAGGAGCGFIPQLPKSVRGVAAGEHSVLPKQMQPAQIREIERRDRRAVAAQAISENVFRTEQRRKSISAPQSGPAATTNPPVPACLEGLGSPKYNTSMGRQRCCHLMVSDSYLTRVYIAGDISTRPAPHSEEFNRSFFNISGAGVAEICKLFG